MAWKIVDERGVEARLRNMSNVVWHTWETDVRPSLLEDPSPTNGDLHIDTTFPDQVWIEGTDVYVTFEADQTNVYLIDAVDIAVESS